MATLQPLITASAAAKSPWAETPLVVVGDGPLAAPSAPVLATDQRATLWVNAYQAQPGDAAGALRALLAVGAAGGAGAAGGDGDHDLEVADPAAYAVLQRPGRRAAAGGRDLIRVLAQGLRGWGVRVIEVADVGPLLRAYALVELLELPVALCHSTLRCFLAAADGRRVAAPLLREGITLAKRQRQELARLPVHDPQALLAAARGLRRATDAPEIHAPDRAYGRVLQAWRRGDTPQPPTANELLLSVSSRMGSNPVANARIVQLAGRVRTAGYFAGPTELLAATA